MITPLNYFPVYSQYNSRKIEAYVEHMGIKCKDKKEVMFITIYKKDNHTMKFVRKVEEALETYIPSLEELEEHGFDEEFYKLYWITHFAAEAKAKAEEKGTES
jgi:hypothetical protein